MGRTNTNSVSLKQMTIVSILVFVAGCTTTHTGAVHDWLHQAPRELYTRVAEVPPTRIHPVAATKRIEASERLKTTAALRVSETEAIGLAGAAADVTGDYLLVRGLCLGCGTGKFWVYENEEVLIVDHFLVGS